MTTALIADDERLLREQLRARLAEVWPELEIVAEAKNGTEAVELTEQWHPDIVFLDIRMPGMTGIEAARAIGQLPVDDMADGVEESDEGGDADEPAETGANAIAPGTKRRAPWAGCEIVFITAYDQYAVEAFEQGVVDYVLKPAERERLQVTIDRIRKRLAARASNEAPDASGMQQLLQKLADKMHPGKASKLKWIQATVGSSIQMIPVDADVFWQIHRSTLVNTKVIAGVTRDLRGRQLVAVRGHPEKLEVSRSYAGLFKGM